MSTENEQYEQDRRSVELEDPEAEAIAADELDGETVFAKIEWKVSDVFAHLENQGYKGTDAQVRHVIDKVKRRLEDASGGNEFILDTVRGEDTKLEAMEGERQMNCDCCGLPIEGDHITHECAGNGDGPGFALCNRPVCQAMYEGKSNDEARDFFERRMENFMFDRHGHRQYRGIM